MITRIGRGRARADYREGEAPERKGGGVVLLLELGEVRELVLTESGGGQGQGTQQSLLELHACVLACSRSRCGVEKKQRAKKTREKLDIKEARVVGTKKLFIRRPP